MNNCCKINLDLFFTDRNNKQISPEFQRAYETLADQPENSAENSVEKFIAELESRLTLIKPLLCEKTEEFLGYCKEDILILNNFFTHKVPMSGMITATVREILCKTWWSTPCEDKRLSFDLYACVDKEFFQKVCSWKDGFSFPDSDVFTQ